MVELVHTSVPRGLDGSGPGYATVAATTGFRMDVARLLAAGSTAAVPRLEPGADAEQFAVYRLWHVGTSLVLTRIVPVEADYSGRPARLAHHLVLEGPEACGSRAAALLMADGVFRDRWSGEPALLPPKDAPPRIADDRSAWAGACFGMLTEHAAEWERHLAAEAGLRSERPTAVLLPARSDLRAVLAAIVRHSPSGRRIRIETSLDHLPDANPAVLLLRGPGAIPSMVQTAADWSGSRGTAAPPARTPDGEPVPVAAPDGARIDMQALPLPIPADLPGPNRRPHLPEPVAGGRPHAAPDGNAAIRTVPGYGASFATYGLGALLGALTVVALAILLR